MPRRRDLDRSSQILQLLQALRAFAGGTKIVMPFYKKQTFQSSKSPPVYDARKKEKNISNNIF